MVNPSRPRLRRSIRGAILATALLAIGATLAATLTPGGVAQADGKTPVIPGDLLLSRVHYAGATDLITPGVTVLPTGGVAIADGDFAHVWDNESVDGNFGISAPIYLDQLTPAGALVNSIAVPDGTPGAASRGHDLLMGSFSSKSELGLNLSTGGSKVTFMGYVTPANTLDASNSNTPGVNDPTNPDGQSVFRAVAELDANGKFWFTGTNAYSGDNGRAAILDEGTGLYYTAGNSNNGAGTAVPGLIFGTGAQLVTPANEPEQAQTPGDPTPVGGFSITQLPANTKADKLGKDTNFNAVAIHDNVLYYTKGSGSNGIDTVYFVDTTGAACPQGVGLPAPGAPLPSNPDPFDPATGQPAGNMCILAGFPTALVRSIKNPETGAASNTTALAGLWFADPATVYVADAGNGTDTFSNGSYTAAAAQTLAGIQKWSLVNGTWTYDYTLNAGLGLGVPYTVAGLPTGTNSITGRPWTPAVDGVRNLTGKVNADGTVTLYAVTSSIGGVSDYGADPNKLVTITDTQAATTLPAGEQFTTLRTAPAGDVFRGLAFAPGTTR
jgi:hypothetical protein